jgi:hypothetical protein
MTTRTRFHNLRRQNNQKHLNIGGFSLDLQVTVMTQRSHSGLQALQQERECRISPPDHPLV